MTKLTSLNQMRIYTGNNSRQHFKIGRADLKQRAKLAKIERKNLLKSKDGRFYAAVRGKEGLTSKELKRYNSIESSLKYLDRVISEHKPFRPIKGLSKLFWETQIADWVLGSVTILSMAAIAMAPVTLIGYKVSRCEESQIKHALGYGYFKSECPEHHGCAHTHSGDLLLDSDKRMQMKKLEELLPAAEGYEDFTMDARCSGVHFSFRGRGKENLDVTVPARAVDDYLREGKPYTNSDWYLPWWLDIMLNTKIG